MRQQLTVQADVVEPWFNLLLPCECSNIVLGWRDCWELGNLIGSNAFCMALHLSDPGQDQATAAELRIERHSDRQLALFFTKTKQIKWTRNVALIVAERICDAATKIAEEINKRRVSKI